MTPLDELALHQIRYCLSSFSALDRFFRQPSGSTVHLAVECSLVDLARVFTELEFPAIEGVDAAISRDEKRYYFSCHEDSITQFQRNSFPVMDLLYDPARDLFLDPFDVYPELRQAVIEPVLQTADPIQILMDMAILAGRYHYQFDGDLPRISAETVPPASETHRRFVVDLFTGKSPWKGLALLMDSGFVEHFWPVFMPMNETDQSKGHHPEGNVWVHSLETLKYRKTTDLVLSLALFLHDCGKPYSIRNGERRFDGHAEIGADIARKFLGALGFDRARIDDVFFLIKFHMVPGALSVLPIWRTEKLMSSPLFPLLLELYRCDLSSTYRGPNGYYEACKVYRAFLKHSSNPFRGTDGKKLVRLYVE